MELIILGSGCGVPSLTRGSPGLVMKVGDEPFLFDSGCGTLERLMRVSISYQRINHIFYTHRHTDHTIELASFLLATNITPGFQREQELFIIGPKGFQRFYEKFLSLYPWLKPQSYQIHVREVWQGPLRTSHFLVEARPTGHTSDSVGYRVETEGKAIVYSGDAIYCESLVQLAKKADLLILECSFPNELEVEGHLTPALAGKIATEAQAKRLVLTHFYPVCDGYDIEGQCRAAFDGEVIVAHDLMRFEL